MKALLQRVSQASVSIDDEIVGSIEQGLLALVGVEAADNAETVAWMADKILRLRIFADEAKPMNQSVLDVGGAVLAVSQFTLAADTSRGRRPSFTTAAPPEHAEEIYQDLVTAMSAEIRVATGRFGADMQVALVNDGPVTFLLER